MTTSTATAQQTLVGAIWPEGSLAKPLRLAILALAGSALLAISAKIQVPMWPVPMTMQTFAVLAIGMAYGWRLAGATVLLYMAEGAIGIPVFSKGGGLAYFYSATSMGYIYGYLPAAMLVGWLAERGWDRNPATTALAMLLGNVTLYVPGLVWLGMMVGWDKPILEWGLTPFIAGDLVKLALAAAIMPLAWKAVRHWRDA